MTTARAGRSVFYSGAAVMVAVLGLVFFPSTGLRSIGAAGALVVFFSVAASVTFMPALLSVLGRRVDSIPVIRLQVAQEGRFSRWWARAVLRRPWASILVALVLIALIVWPAATMKTEMVSASTLPKAAESRQGMDILDTEFDRAALSPVSVLLTWESEKPIDMTRAATFFLYGQRLSTMEGVAAVQSPFTITGLSDPAALVALWPQFEGLLNDPDSFVVPEEGITLKSGQTITAQELNQFKMLIKATVAKGAVQYYVVSEDLPGSLESRELVERLLASDVPAGYELHVTGESAHNYDFFEELSDWFPWVFAWVVVISLVVFVLLLRSVVLPLVAVLINLLTIGMSYGILVLLFQGDTFERILRFTSTGAINIVIPVVMLCVLFGITMDYAVFMLTRMHERWHRSGDNRESVVTGIMRTARIIISAALLVVIVTGAFAFTSIAETKMLGLGIALAIIADTLLIRLVLLPALMAYLGKWNWWWPTLKRGKNP